MQGLGLADCAHPRTARPASREGLQRNVVLIRELNNNIAKVVALYRELSVRCAPHLDAGVPHGVWLSVRRRARAVPPASFVGAAGEAAGRA
jgi:hypothetical protein